MKTAEHLAHTFEATKRGCTFDTTTNFQSKHARLRHFHGAIINTNNIHYNIVFLRHTAQVHSGVPPNLLYFY